MAAHIGRGHAIVHPDIYDIVMHGPVCGCPLARCVSEPLRSRAAGTQHGGHVRTSLAACLLLVGGVLALETAWAGDEEPVIDVTALLGELARSKPLSETVSAWEKRGRPESERYFRTTSNQLGVLFTDLSSLQVSMYMRRASIRTLFGENGDPFESGAVAADSTLTVDCRTMTYQHGETKLLDKDGKILRELNELSEPADSKREGPWYEASMLLCSS